MNEFREHLILKDKMNMAPLNTYIQYDCRFNTRLIRQISQNSSEDSPGASNFEFDFSGVF